MAEVPGGNLKDGPWRRDGRRVATLRSCRGSSFQHPLFFFREQPVDLIGEFEELYGVLLGSRPFCRLDPGFSRFALHVKMIRPSAATRAPQGLALKTSRWFPPSLPDSCNDP
jgi:hypothetical protein